MVAARVAADKASISWRKRMVEKQETDEGGGSGTSVIIIIKKNKIIMILLVTQLIQSCVYVYFKSTNSVYIQVSCKDYSTK